MQLEVTSQLDHFITTYLHTRPLFFSMVKTITGGHIKEKFSLKTARYIKVPGGGHPQGSKSNQIKSNQIIALFTSEPLVTVILQSRPPFPLTSFTVTILPLSLQKQTE